jgi:hypothetical protein
MQFDADLITFIQNIIGSIIESLSPQEIPGIIQCYVIAIDLPGFPGKGE